VDDGDATLIGIIIPLCNPIPAQSWSMGSKAPAERLLPYLKKVLNSSSRKVTYVALGHYHDDIIMGCLQLKIVFCKYL